MKKYNIKDEQTFSQELGELLSLALEVNKPYLVKIDRNIHKQIKEMDGKGNIVINLKIYEGNVQQAVFTQMTKVSFN